MVPIDIRDAVPADLEQIVMIYNQAVYTGFQTADTIPWNVADKKEWFIQHLHPGFPLFVALIDGSIVGWVSISAYRPGREALRNTKEISYYVHNAYLRQGIGQKLVQYAVNQYKEYKAETLIAIILDVNIASIQLMEKMRFSKWAHLPLIADFNGKKCGHVYYGLSLTGLVK